MTVKSALSRSLAPVGRIVKNFQVGFILGGMIGAGLLLPFEIYVAYSISNDAYKLGAVVAPLVGVTFRFIGFSVVLLAVIAVAGCLFGVGGAAVEALVRGLWYILSRLWKRRSHGYLGN